MMFSKHLREVHCQWMNLLPQSFAGDGVTGNAFESEGFLAMGDDGTSGDFFGFGQTHGC